MVKKFFAFSAICFYLWTSFGEYYPCQIEIITISTPKDTVLFDGNEAHIDKPIYDEIADEKYQKNLVVDGHSLQITANIDVTVNGFYPLIKCQDDAISWILTSDGRGLFSLYVADKIDIIKDALGHIKKDVEANGMYYTDIVMQSSSDFQEKSN